MYLYKCKLCNIEFNSIIKNRTFCTNKCYHSSRVGKLAWNSGLKGYHNNNRKIFSWQNKDRIMKNCLGCNNQMVDVPCYINNRKYCSRLCYVNYNNEKNHPMYGFKHTDETKDKISLSKKGKKLSEEQKIKRKEIMKNYKNGMLGKTHSKETRNKLSLLTIKQFAEGRTAKSTNTSIEIKMKDLLNKMNINYIHQYNFNNKFVCDFAIPDKKLVIECDGDYWHNYPYGHKKDNAKNAYIQTCGWKILRFWERDINKNIEKCGEILSGHIN